MKTQKTNNQKLQIVLAIFGVLVLIITIFVATNSQTGNLFKGSVAERNQRKNQERNEQQRYPALIPQPRTQNTNRPELTAQTGANRETTSLRSDTSQRPRENYTNQSNITVLPKYNTKKTKSENINPTDFTQNTTPAQPPTLQINKNRNKTVGDQVQIEFLNFNITTEAEPLLIKELDFNIQTTSSQNPTQTKNPNCPNDSKEQCFSCSITSDNSLIAPNGDFKQTKFTPFDSGYLIPPKTTKNFSLKCIYYSIRPDTGTKILTNLSMLKFEQNQFETTLDKNSPELQNIISDEITITSL